MDNNLVYSINNLTLKRKDGAEYKLEIPKLAINRGEKIALLGPSGCGKSTVLDILAGILRPDTADTFLLNPTDKQSFNIIDLWKNRQENSLAAMRLAHMGYILQTGGLLPFLNVKDNIMLAFNNINANCHAEILNLAQLLGIDRLLTALPAKLSVGERQRVAIVRALATKPSIILADEPTAALDPINANIVMKIFTDLTKSLNITVILVTHTKELAIDFNFKPIYFSLSSENKMITARVQA